MRGLGAFQAAQTKHRDVRVFALCQHLRSAIDLWEQIAADPYLPPGKPEPPVAAPAAPPPPPVLPPQKLTYTIKETAAALGIGQTTIYAAIADGSLAAFKLGNRTLIEAEALRAWLASMPRVKRPRAYRK